MPFVCLQRFEPRQNRPEFNRPEPTVYCTQWLPRAFFWNCCIDERYFFMRRSVILISPLGVFSRPQDVSTPCVPGLRVTRKSHLKTILPDLDLNTESVVGALSNSYPSQQRAFLGGTKGCSRLCQLYILYVRELAFRVAAAAADTEYRRGS
jgi:hypothetical protein